MLAKLALERADCVVARDEESFKVLRELAPRAHAVQSVDVAFMLPFADRSAERGGAKLRVGVNASGLLYPQAESGNKRFGLSYAYAKFNRELLERLCDRDDVKVNLVPHSPSHTDTPTTDNTPANRPHPTLHQEKLM